MLKWIEHVPVDVSNDGDGDNFIACGVWLLDRKPHRLSDRDCWALEDALKAKAAAEGVNMEVALTPWAWLLHCRRCKAPFIGLPDAKVCSDACREEAKRYAVHRASAKRAKRRAEASNARTSACRHCGERLPARRSTKRFCSVGCRVAAHRGAPATYTVEWPDIGETSESAWRSWGKAYVAGLDRKIADTKSILGAAKCGYVDATTLRRVMHVALALQAERAKLTT